MGSGLCSCCKGILTSENSNHTVFTKKAGYCRTCYLVKRGPYKKRLGKCLCSGCKGKGIIKPLTEDNCCPSVFKKRKGSCRECMREDSLTWGRLNPGKRKAANDKYTDLHPETVLVHGRKWLRTFKGRHRALKYKSTEDGIPKEDPILNLRFYTELIRDSICHYCLGPLNATSHGLDCMDNDLGHRGFNVVPCCKSCNQKKMNDTTYEEMMLLAPALREIRRRRELQNVVSNLPSL